MPGFIINGREVQVPGLEVINFKDDPNLRLKMGEDGKRRSTHWVRSIGVHSTKGIPGGSDHRAQVILPGMGPASTNAERVAKYWTTDPTSAGAHLVVDHDGTIVCLADLLTEMAFHAGASNADSIGIETYQGKDAEFYDGQLDVVVLLIDALTYLFTETLDGSLQRQFHAPYRAYHPMSRMDGENGNYVGIYGHRDQTANRGPGDPGDWLAQKLAAAGYESFNFEKGTDLEAWKVRQADLGVDADGVPGPKTARALRAAGPSGTGLWVTRPLDAQLAALGAPGPAQDGGSLSMAKLDKENFYDVIDKAAAFAPEEVAPKVSKKRK
jgi:hypothetical protein